jgi:hypothetical protein
MPHNFGYKLHSADAKDRRVVGSARIGCISLALSLAEIAAIGTAILFGQSTSHHNEPSQHHEDSLGLAVAGLVADARRFSALFAIVLTVFTFSLRFAVLGLRALANPSDVR